ncbi:MAG: phosphate-starvation-inducible PsiE family protein [Geovibrio sp.]|nr:phosphate-starvation-inducible PsiE family protein [Geovibrio sp.]
MKYYKNLQKSYDVTEDDLRNIASLKEIMEKHKEDFVRDVFESFTKKFRLPDSVYPVVLAKHREFLLTWYDRFFEARLNNAYLAYLEKFGNLQKKYEIDYEWINAMMSYIRLWIHERIFQSLDDDVYRKNILLSVHKFMDINVDAVNYAFCENKIREYTSIFSIKNFVVSVSEKFSFLMHTLMVGILITMTAAAAVLFGIEIIHLLEENADKVLITALGSLLIIWVLVELLHTEIQMLKGGKFKISIFIGVALIAFIRDLLIITLKHETSNPMTYGFVLVSIAVLGVIYWMITKTEK